MVTTAEIYSTVEAPGAAPRRFGLFSVAPPISPAGTTWQFGVQWESIACAQVGYTVDPCITGTEPEPKQVHGCDDIALGSAKPFTVLSFWRLPGTRQNLNRTARAALTAGAEAVVEAWLWDQLGAEVPADVGGDPVTALALVERDVARNYHGRGVIHVDPATATLLGDHLVGGGDQLATRLGTVVVVGAGYGPDNDSLESVIYGTGAVAVRSSDISVVDAALLAINDFEALAEQTFVVGWDCFATARTTTIGGQ